MNGYFWEKTMKIIAVAVLTWTLLLSPVALASDDAHAEAEMLLSVTGMEQAIEQTKEQMLDVQLRQNPALAPYKHVMLEFFRKYMSYESIKPQLVELYAEAFSAAELKEINAFYRTPTGEKTIAVMPTLMTKSAMIGAARVEENVAELQRMIQDEAERIQELQAQ